MADLAPVYDALKKADAAGDSAGAKRLADYIRSSAPPPPKENLPDAAMQREQQIQAGNLAMTKPQPLPGFSDVRDMISSIPKGMNTAASGMVEAASHPIDAVTGLYKKGLSAIDSGINAVMSPVDTTKKVGELLKNVKPQQVGEMIGSSAMGGAAGKAAGVLGDVAGPAVKTLVGGKPVSQEIKDLANKGVVTTPGQRGGLGSLRDSIEQKLTSLPVGGENITARRGEAVKRWSAEKLDDALNDVGGKPVPKNKAGRDAYLHTYTEIQNKYNSLLPKMSGDLNNAAGGTSLHQDLTGIRTQAAQKGNGIRPTEQKHLLSIIDNDVIARFDASGKATGKTLGDIKDVLDKEIQGYKSGNNSERKVAAALEQVRTKVNDMMRRENPQLAGELKKADQAYAKFQAAMLASKYAGKAAEGSFTPNQYLRSVESRDATKNKRAFGTGTAPGQKEAESASKILGNNVPDSGTPGRLELIKMLKNPWESGLGLVSAGVTPLIYSKPVQKFLQKRALNKGGAYKPIGKSAPIAGAALGVAPDDQTGVAP